MSTLRLISADSHVVEPTHCYVDYVEPKYKDRVPHFVPQAGGGEALIVEDFPPLKAGALAPSGHRLGSPELAKMTLAEANRGAFDPRQRCLEPSENRALDFKGEFRRSAICSATETIDIDWSIFSLIAGERPTPAALEKDRHELSRSEMAGDVRFLRRRAISRDRRS